MIKIIQVVTSIVLMVILVKGRKSPSGLFIFSIVGGVFVSNACQLIGMEGGVSMIWTGLIVVCMVFICIKYKVSIWTGSVGEISMVLIVLVLFYSMTYTKTPVYGRYKVELFVVSCFPLYFFGKVCGSKDKLVKNVFVNGYIITLLLVWYYFVLYVLGKGNMGEMERFGEGMSIMYGIMINQCAAMLIYPLYHEKNKIRKAIVITTIGVAVILLPLTGSRGAVVMPITTFLLTYVSFKRVMKSIGVAIMIIGVSVMLFKAFAPPVMKERIQYMDYEESGRAVLFSTALKIFNDNKLQGVGAGGFALYDKNRLTGIATDRRSYPHNLWLEIASEQGIYGLIPLLVITIYGFIHLVHVRRMNVRGVSEPIQVLFWVCFFHACFTSDLPAFRGFFAMAGFLAGVNRNVKKKKKRKRIYAEKGKRVLLTQSKVVR